MTALYAVLSLVLLASLAMVFKVTTSSALRIADHRVDMARFPLGNEEHRTKLLTEKAGFDRKMRAIFATERRALAETQQARSSSYHRGQLLVDDERLRADIANLEAHLAAVDNEVSAELQTIQRESAERLAEYEQQRRRALAADIPLFIAALLLTSTITVGLVWAMVAG